MNENPTGKLKDLQQKLGVQIPITEVQTLLHNCPYCKMGTRITIAVFGKRGPPSNYLMETKPFTCS
jgi:hypothetical protein